MDKVKNIVMLGDSLSQSGGIAILQNLIFKYATAEVKIVHIASHDQGSMVFRGIVFIKALGHLLWRLSTQKTDLVHIHVSDGGSILRKSIIALIAFLFNKPVLIHTHGAVFHINYSRLPTLAQKIIGWIFRQSKGLIALTSFWKDFYVTNLLLEPKSVFILLNPIELPTHIPQRNNSSKIKLIFIGRLGKRKGTFDLINAFAKLPESLINNSELILAGDGEIDKGRELVENLNLTNAITFLGLIDTHQRDLLLNQANIYILPTYNEGLPLALLEAMAWGLPVITTPVSGIPDIVHHGENGLLVTPGNIEELSKTMQLLIENENLRLTLGIAARSTVARLDMKSYWCRLSEIYDLIIGNGEWGMGNRE